MQTKRLTILILVVFIGLSFQAQTSFAQTTDALIKSIKDCDAKADDACMVQFAGKGIELYPTNEDFYYFRGAGLIGLKRYSEAIADETKAIALYPKYPAALNLRGVAYIKINDYDKAVADFRKATEIDPSFEGAKKNLEFALAKQKPAEPSSSDTDTSPVVSLLIKAQKAQKAGDTVAQEKYLTEAISVGRRDIDAKDGKSWLFEAYKVRSVLYKSQEKFDLALADAQQLAGLDPKNKDLYILRGGIYFNMDDYPNEIADYTTLLGLNLKPEETVDIYAARGNGYRKNHDYDQAVADFTKVISLVPNDKDSLAHRAEIYQFQGYYDLAEADYKKLLKILPDNALSKQGLEDIKMLKNAGFNTGKTKEVSLLLLDEIQADSLIFIKRYNAVTSASVQAPKDKRRICTAIAETNIFLQKVEMNSAKLNQELADGKLDKLPSIKQIARETIKLHADDRAMLNADVSKYSCKLN